MMVYLQFRSLAKLTAALVLVVWLSSYAWVWRTMEIQHLPPLDPSDGQSRREISWNFASMHAKIIKNVPLHQVNLRCNLPLLLFVSGQGNQGKSSITRALETNSKMHPLQKISLDAELQAWYFASTGERADGKKLYKIYNRFFFHRNEEEEFAEFVANKYRNTTATVLVVEGCGLNRKRFREFLHKKIGGQLDLLNFEVSGGAVFFENYKVVDAVAMRTPSLNQNHAHLFDWAPQVSAHNVMVFIQHLYVIYLQSHSGSQCYEEIQSCGSTISTANQYKLLNVPDLTNQTAMDVDCAEGYIAAHMAQSALRVLCLETNPKLAHIAKCYGKIIMDAASVIYTQERFLELEGESAMFDFIAALQFWKYEPSEFLACAARLLKYTGILAVQIPKDKFDKTDFGVFRIVYIGPGVVLPPLSESVVVHLTRDANLPSLSN